LDAIHSGQELDLLELTRPEILSVKDLPGSLGAGEAESIALCLSRPGTHFLTNDKRARSFCRERGIPCLDLPGILRALWVRKAIPKKKVRELVRRIETEQGMVIKNKDQIFK
jgi:predicted nucleic acid-binding protein